LESSNERFEVKLLHQDLLSRLIGLHQLLLLNFYPYLQRFLQPHQRQVTKILLYVAQASHEFVPPDLLQSICKTIANNFITERNSGEVMAVGFVLEFKKKNKIFLYKIVFFCCSLNTIREICARCYLAMDEDLLHDLSKYKSYRDKSVSASARSLIQLFREKNPHLLERKDRGKPTEFQRDLIPLDYGQANPKSYLEGAEILQEDDKDPEKLSNDGDDDEEEGDQSEEQGWVDVSHSDDDDDDEDEEEEEGEDNGDNQQENENKVKIFFFKIQHILAQITIYSSLNSRNFL
jgi:protein SDA1